MRRLDDKDGNNFREHGKNTHDTYTALSPYGVDNVREFEGGKVGGWGVTHYKRKRCVGALRVDTKGGAGQAHDRYSEVG